MSVACSKRKKSRPLAFFFIPDSLSSRLPFTHAPHENANSATSTQGEVDPGGGGDSPESCTSNGQGWENLRADTF